ncbi:MAG: phage tail tape measure protein, partial [Bacilli bacterium]|nr:phage tail tape measure protein [Bacilli bacterium]
MADDLNIILGTKIDSSGKSVTEINKQITDLSTKIKSLKISINIDDTVISSLNNKIDKLKQQFNIGAKFKIDDTDINKTQLKIQKIFGKSIKFNPEIDSQGISDFKQRVNDIRSDIDKLAKVEINTSKNGSIKSALITYKDEMGQLVQETMTWQNHLNKSGDLLKRVFTTTNVKYVDDLEKATKELEKQNKNLLSQESYFNRINKTVLSLKENISNTSITKGLDVNNFKTDIQNIDTLISNMKNMDINSDIYAKSKVSLDGMIKNVQHKLTLDKDQLNQLKKQEDIYSRINRQLANLKDVTVKNDKYDNTQYTKLVSGYNSIKTAVENGTMSFSKADTELKKLSATTKDFEVNAKKASNTTNAFSATFKRFMSYFTIYKSIELTRRAITEMVSAVTKLDTAMYNIQMVTGETREETEQLMLSYNKLGKELGATTLEVSTSANEFLRQGKTIQETNTLIKNAMVLSKVGMISSAESTQYLTSAMKGYNVEVSKSLDIIDKLSAVDMVSATSAGGLADAMSRTASSAKLAGVEMDKLIGYLALVGEVTQQDMGTIGASFRTIFARMGNVKLGKLVDEEGNDITTQISDVEKVLDKVNIKLRLNATEFRNFGDVLDDVGKNWDEFNEVEQNAIATTFAGVRRREQFLVLMQNYGTALKYAETAMNSTGTAMRKFEIYQESIEAKTNKLRTAFELLSTKTLNSGLIKGIVDLSTEILTLINNVGGLIPVLTSVGLIWLGWKTSIVPTLIGQIQMLILAQTGYTASTVASAVAQVGLAGAIKATTVAMRTFLLTNPVGWAILAVGGIATLVTAFNSLEQASKKALETTNQKITEFEDLQTQKSKIQDLGNQFSQLRRLSKEQELNNEEQQRFVDLQNEIKELVPEVNGYYDKQGNFIISETENIKSLTEAYEKLLDAKREELFEASKESYGYNINTYEKEKQKLEDLIRTQELLKISKERTLTDDERFELSMIRDRIRVPFDELEKTIKESRSSIKNSLSDIQNDIRNALFSDDAWKGLSDKTQDIVIEELSKVSEKTLPMLSEALYSGKLSFQEFINVLIRLNNESKKTETVVASQKTKFIELQEEFESGKISLSEYTKQLQILNKETAYYQREIDDLARVQEYLGGIIDKVTKNQSLSKDEVQKLVSLYPELENAIYETIDGWSVENDTLNILNTTIGKFKDAYINAQNAISLALTNQSVKRLGITLAELEGIQSIADAYNLIGRKLGTSTDDARREQLMSKNGRLREFSDIFDIGKAKEDIKKMQDDILKGFNPSALGDSLKSSADKAISEIDRLRQELDALLQDKDFEISVLEFSGGEVQKQISIYQQMQDEVHKLAQKYRSMGLSENDDYIQQLRTQWMDYANNIANLQSISFDNSNKSIDRTITQLELEQQLLKENSQEYIDIENKKYDEIVKREQLLQAEITRLQAIGTAQAKEQAEELIDIFYDTVSQRYNIIKNLQSAQISILEKQKSALEDLHKFTMQMIKDELNAKKKAIQEEIKGIEKVFNKRKQALRDEKDDRDYNKGLTEKSAVVADLENQLAIIKNDETAIAKRKQLEEELTKAKEDLADYQYKHSIDLAEKALDEELEIRKSALEEEIDELDSTLSNEVKMRELANKRIEKSGEKLKTQLIKHAKEYGTFTEE